MLTSVLADHQERLCQTKRERKNSKVTETGPSALSEWLFMSNLPRSQDTERVELPLPCPSIDMIVTLALQPILALLQHPISLALPSL